MSAKTETYVSFIVKELKKGNVSRDVCFNLHKTAQNCPKPPLGLTQFKTYWKLANIEYKSWLIEQNKAEDEIIVDSSKKLLQNGLDSRDERVLNMQSLKKSMQSILDSGVTKESFYDYKTNSAKSFERPITIQESTKLVETIKNLDAEISKTLGEYAAKQVEQKNTHEMIGLAAEFVDRS
jgi:hypothetical protein